MFDKDKITILDGAMGTMLQSMGIELGQIPEEINITSANTVKKIHKAYIDAGADIIYTNTFGANRYKLSESKYSVCDIVKSGVKAAKEAAGNTALTALSVGPIGQMLEPNGNLKFDDAYDMFKEMVVCGSEAGADLIVFETISDLLEMKAAVLAAKENSNLPILSTMTFEASQRTFSGVSVEAMAATLEGLGVDAVGFNCSLGPDNMLELVRRLSKATTLPIAVKANAGLPNLDTNEYDVSAQSYLKSVKKLVNAGASIIGGCCGTTPEYIKLLKDTFKEKPPVKRKNKKVSVLSSGTNAIIIDGVKIVGERINPTGKKLFKEALKNGDISYILTQAIEQINAGAHILDVNVGLPEINEREMMTETVKQIQSVADVPLQLDSTNTEVIESALRIYNGKALVNSVNGEEKSLNSVLPLVKKYGAAVIGLTLDENGIPPRAEDRYKIAEKIVRRASEYGISKEDIYIDCLTLTASVQQKEVRETLKALKMVKKKLKVKTVLGVSNISFGLPDREAINSSFLTLALEHGLDLAIINPNIKSMTDAVDAFNVLYNKDKGADEYIKKHTVSENKVLPTSPGEISLEEAVRSGIKDAAGKKTEELLLSKAPLDIVNDILIPSLDKVGQDFEKNIIFLPQLIQSATAAKAGFDVIKAYMSKNMPKNNISKGKIILATVKGDIHDIGKNIVKVVLENYGYEVIDLGKDVPPETVVEQTVKNNVHLVGLSALMTTTVISMEETILALRNSGADCRIMVGGAVLTEDYAMKIGADYYAKDAKQSADIAKTVLG